MSYFDDPANDATAYETEMQDRFAPLATMSDAHAEWHLNSGVPMGMPGCPQDACHPHEDYDEDAEIAKFGGMETDYWSPVEQGMYDDDPNPYHGDYSEW